MDVPKILVAAPVFSGMDYCMGDFVERVKSFSWGDYDVLLVDNSSGSDYARDLRERYGVDVVHLDFGDEVGIQKIIGSRNYILDYALENSYDYILMMDCDVIAPVDAVDRLVGHDKDIVSGLYFSVFRVDGKQKLQSVAWKCLTEEEWEEVKGGLLSRAVCKREDIRRNLTDEEIDSGELQEVIIPSCGCMLIRNSVFEKVRYGLLDVPAGFKTSDDIYFARKARDAGIELYCDPAVRCEHLTEGKFGKDGVHPARG